MPDLEQPSAADSLYFAGQGVIERALRFQPDWVLIWSAMFLHPDIIVSTEASRAEGRDYPDRIAL